MIHANQKLEHTKGDHKGIRQFSFAASILVLLGNSFVNSIFYWAYGVGTKLEYSESGSAGLGIPVGDLFVFGLTGIGLFISLLILIPIAVLSILGVIFALAGLGRNSRMLNGASIVLAIAHVLAFPPVGLTLAAIASTILA